jgi:hypothetical protein
MPQTQEQLFVITASNPDAKRHIEKSIANSIEPAICTQHFDSAVLDEVMQKSADGKLKNFYIRRSAIERREYRICAAY